MPTSPAVVDGRFRHAVFTAQLRSPGRRRCFLQYPNE